MRHKHADLMIAWANNINLKIETYNIIFNRWVICKEPHWCEYAMYRIAEPSRKYYKVALFVKGYTVTADNPDNAGIIEQNTDFSKWLTDWIEYE